VEYFELNENEGFLVSQKAILLKNKKILLLKHFDFDAWGLPGGLINFDEDFFDGLKREIYEETNLILKKAKVFCVSSVNYKHFIFNNKLKKNVRIIQIGYLCKFEGENIVLSDEHVDYKWIEVKNMDLNKISLDSRQIVGEFINLGKFDII